MNPSEELTLVLNTYTALHAEKKLSSEAALNLSLRAVDYFIADPKDITTKMYYQSVAVIYYYEKEKVQSTDGTQAVSEPDNK